MIYKIIFEDKNYITIDFFNNHGAKIVIDNLKQDYCFSKYTPLILETDYNKNDQIMLFDYFKRIEDLGYNIPFNLKKAINQEALNLYHRFFTENSVWAWHYNYKQGTPTNPYDKNFQYSQIPSYEEWLDLIHGVNTYVHKLESSIETKNKNFIIKNNLNFFYADIRSNDNNVHNPTFKTLKDPEVHLEYTKTFSSVILAEEIQGKSYLRAFIDDDDPRCNDITGRIGSYGGFCIDFSDHRQKIYQSEEFRRWLLFYKLNTTQVYLEYPVGNLLETSYSKDFEITNIKEIQIQ